MNPLKPEDARDVPGAATATVTDYVIGLDTVGLPAPKPASTEVIEYLPLKETP